MTKPTPPASEPTQAPVINRYAYAGDAFLPGVPARDLTPVEYDQLVQAGLIPPAHLYTPVYNPGQE